MIELDRRDRRAAAILAIMTLFCYAYFFQGDGWNQYAHFDTVRALVERHTAEITEFAANTGDISTKDDRIYSNKPPGLALLATPVYWAAIHVERIIGINPDSVRSIHGNLHLLTAFTSAWPGVMGVLGLYVLFRRLQSSVSQSLLLAGAYAFGSLSWPYSGVMMNHLAVAAGLLWSWLLLSDPRRPVREGNAWVAGSIMGFVALCDYFAAPLAGLFLIYLIARRSRIRIIAIFLAGPIAGLGSILIFNAIVFGHPLSSTYTYEDPSFKEPGLLFGQFHAPDFRRLYWISYHKMRGLFVCCPLFMIPVISLLVPRRWSWKCVRLENIVPLIIVCYYIIFMMTFVAWTGGWGVGPRYMIPALPLIWIFAKPAFERYPWISLLLTALSTANMLAVAAARLLQPANDRGEPGHWDPLGASWLAFIRGQLSQNPGSYNLGQAVGIHGWVSLIPVFLAMMILGWTIIRMNHEEQNLLTPGSVLPAPSTDG